MSGDTGIFLIDTAADVNAVKTGILAASVTIDPSHILEITGISTSPIKTLGVVEMKIFDKHHKFHVLPPTTPILQDAILGAPFFNEEKARICYNLEVLILASRPTDPIPFCNRSPQALDAERGLFQKITGNKKRVCTMRPTTLYRRLPARSRIALNIPVTQASPSGEGYLAQIPTPQGVYIGEASVTNVSGRCFVMAINTCSHEVDIEIPPQQLQPFDVDMSEDFFESDSETHDEPPVVERIEHICERLHREHHDGQATEQIRRIVEKYHHLFLLKGDPSPRTHVVKHHINTVDDRPIFTKQYRYPPALHQEVREQVDKLLKDNVIQPSESPYNSPLWIVPKKPGPDGKKKYRLVIDYRKLNEKTIPDAYPLPNITEILEHVGGAKLFSVFNLASGFHQIEMEPRDRQKTAFSTPYGHYEYVCMPFGVNNATSHGSRFIGTARYGTFCLSR